MSRDEQLRLFLRQFFDTERYDRAIEAARDRIARDPEYAARWKLIGELIRSRGLAEGRALELVHHAANQVLEENTDDEAWAWLDRMVENIERSDSPVNEY